MSQARSGELDVELGHQGPNANEACCTSANALGRRVTASCRRRACDSPCVTRPDPLAFGWPPDRGPYTKRRTGGLRDCCPRVEPRHN